MSTPPTPYSSSGIEAADKARRVASAISSSAPSLFAGSFPSSSLVAPNSAVQESIALSQDAKAEAKAAKSEAKAAKEAKAESKEEKADSKEAKAAKAESKEESKEYKAVTEALCEYYSNQEKTYGASSTVSRQLTVIKVRLVEECQEKKEDMDSKNTEAPFEAKEAKPPSAPQASQRYHENRCQIRKTLEIKDLFGTSEAKEIKKVLIIGRAGVGKTVFTQYIAYQWSKNQLWQDRFKYVFCLSLKRLTKYTDQKDLSAGELFFQECLVKKFRPAEQEADLKRSIDIILTGANTKVLLVLDGYDEIVGLQDTPAIKNIFDKLMHCPNVILTSRPYRLDGLHHIKFDRRLENTGFSAEQVAEYIHNYFSEQKDQEAMLKWMQSQDMTDLAETPIHLNILCALYEAKSLPAEDKEQPVNLSCIYRQMVHHILCACAIRTATNLTPVETETKYASELDYLGRLALKAFEHNQVTIQPETFAAVDQDLVNERLSLPSKDKIFQMGLLKAIDNSATLDVNKPHEFLHLSYLEFLLARFIWRQLPSGPALNFIRTEKYNPTYYKVFNFIAGLVHLDAINAIPLQSFWHELLSEPLDLTGIGHIGLMIRCLDGCQLDRRIPNLEERMQEVQHWLGIRICDEKLYSSNFVLKRLVDDLFIPFLRDSSDFFRRPFCNGVFLKALEAKEVGARRNALYVIERLGEKAATPEIIDWIGRALDAKEARVRINALHMISGLGKKAATQFATPEIIDWIGRALDAKEEYIRRSALGAICIFGKKFATPKILNGIKRALDAKEVDVKEDALYVIFDLDEKATILSLIREALVEAEGVVDNVKKWYVLPKIRFDSERFVTPDILGLIREVLDAKEARVRKNALYLISDFGEKAATPEILNGIIVALDAKDEDVREIALYVIKFLGEKAAIPKILDRVIVALDAKENKRTRTEALYVIGRLGEKAATPKILDRVRVALDAKDEDVKEAALCAIRGLGEKAATPEILGWIGRALDAKEEYIRRAALGAIGSFGKKFVTPKILDRVRVALDAKENKRTRTEALYVIERLGEKAATPEILNGIRVALDAKDEDVKRAALCAIGELSAKFVTLEILDLVVEALDAKEAYIGSDAFKVIEKLEITSVAKSPKILEILISKSLAGIFYYKDYIPFLMRMSLSNLLSNYSRTPSSASLSTICFIFVNLALIQGNAVTISDNQIRIFSSRQIFTIKIPREHLALISELKRGFSLTLHNYGSLNPFITNSIARNASSLSPSALASSSLAISSISSAPCAFFGSSSAMCTAASSGSSPVVVNQTFNISVAHTTMVGDNSTVTENAPTIFAPNNSGTMSANQETNRHKICSIL